MSDCDEKLEIIPRIGNRELALPPLGGEGTLYVQQHQIENQGQQLCNIGQVKDVMLGTLSGAKDIHKHFQGLASEAVDVAHDDTLKGVDRLALVEKSAKTLTRVYENESEALEYLSQGSLKLISGIVEGMEKASQQYAKNVDIAMAAEQKLIETEKKKNEARLAAISARYKEEDERTQRINEENERHAKKVEELEEDARVKKWDLEKKQMDAQIDQLEKRDRIDNRVLLEEFNIQVKLYEQQLADARKEIEKVANKKSYNLTYDPPKIIEQGGKRIVKPGTVAYKIN